MATQKKIDTVTSLTEKFSRAKAIIIADYRGLKHKQFEEVRKSLKKLEADLLVAKNRLVLRALGGQSKDLEQNLHGPTAVLISYEDVVTPLKALLKYFKTAGTGNPKAGLLGNQVLTETDVTKLASLPTRQILLGQLVSQLNAPIQGLHYALSWNTKKLVYVLDNIRSKRG